MLAVRSASSSPPTNTSGISSGGCSSSNTRSKCSWPRRAPSSPWSQPTRVRARRFFASLGCKEATSSHRVSVRSW